MESTRFSKRTTRDRVSADTVATASSGMASHSTSRSPSQHMKASHLVSSLITRLGSGDSSSSDSSTTGCVVAGPVSRTSSASISRPAGSIKSNSSCKHVDHAPSGALQQQTAMPSFSWAGTSGGPAAVTTAVAGLTDPGTTSSQRACNSSNASKVILSDTVVTPQGPATQSCQQQHSPGVLNNSIHYLPDHVFLLDDPDDEDCSSAQEAQDEFPELSSNNNMMAWQGTRTSNMTDAARLHTDYVRSHSTPLPTLEALSSISVSADGIKNRSSCISSNISATLSKLTVPTDGRLAASRHELGSPASQALHYKQNHGYLPSPSSSAAGQAVKGVKDRQSIAEATRSSRTCSLLSAQPLVGMYEGVNVGTVSSVNSGELPALPPGAVPQFGSGAANSSNSNSISQPSSASAIAAAASDAWQPLSLTSGQLLVAVPTTLQDPVSCTAARFGGSGSLTSGRTTPTQACNSMKQLQVDQHQQQQQQQSQAVCEAPVPLISLALHHTPEPVLLAVSPRLPPYLQRSKWCLADFVKHKKLYDGYASTIYKAMDRQSGQIVALKLYHMNKLNSISIHQVAREVRLHIGLNHDNIIGLHAAFQEAGDVVLVQEYASSGDLWSFIDANSGRLSERMTVSLVLQPFLRALQYLHFTGIVHRDIKPENVLFSSNMVLKIADFGLALNIREERAVTRVGTLDYMAPEVLRCPLKRHPGDNKDKSELHYSEAVDAWAVGVLAYELLTGRAPFSASSASDAAIEAAIQSAAPSFSSRMSEPAVEFITMALQKNPSKRPSILQLIQHPWIRSFKRSTSHDRVDSLSDPGISSSHKLHQPNMLQQLLSKKEPVYGHDDSCMTGYASGTR